MIDIVMVAFIKITRFKSNNRGHAILSSDDSYYLICLKLATHGKSGKRYMLPQVAFSSIFF